MPDRREASAGVETSCLRSPVDAHTRGIRRAAGRAVERHHARRAGWGDMGDEADLAWFLACSSLHASGQIMNIDGCQDKNIV